MKAIKPEIEFNILESLDIRMGQIIRVERVPETNKLYKLSVIFGKDTSDEKTIVSAIAEIYTEEDLLASIHPFILNLHPRKIRGIVSDGMILFAENSETGEIQSLEDSAMGSIVF